MSEAPSQSESSSSSLQRVDWLAIAPWTLLLQTPCIALGKPFLLATIGAALLGGLLPQQSDFDWDSFQGIQNSIFACVGALVSAPAELIGQVKGGSEWPSLLMKTGWLFAWIWFGLAIIEHASRGLIAKPSISLGRSLRRATLNLPKTIGIATLAVTATLPFTIVLLLADFVNQSDFLSQVVSTIWPLLTVVCGLPIFLLLGGLILGGPLSLAAIVIDQADLFDATSRMYAYTIQRPAKLLFYVGFATALGLVSLYLLQLAFHGIELIMLELIPIKNPGETNQGGINYYSILTQGYASAYFFTAASAIYFLLRKNVDDQPLDEMLA